MLNSIDLFNINIIDQYITETAAVTERSDGHMLSITAPMLLPLLFACMTSTHGSLHIINKMSISVL